MELHKDEININKYASGELDDEALKEFEDLLEKDKALQEKVDAHKFMDAVLYKNIVTDDEDIQTELKPLLKELGSKYFSNEEFERTGKKSTSIPLENKQSKPNRIRRLLPFAALAAAAAVLLFLFIPNQENKLYTQFFEPPAIDISLSNQTNPSTFDKANKAYKSKNYKEAVVLYNEYLLEDSNNPMALLFRGGAELALKQTDAAMLTFQKLVQNQKYADIANWYLALAYLKKEDKERAKSNLKRISNEDKEYYDKAQQLLKKL